MAKDILLAVMLLAILGALFGVLLAYLSDILHVEVDTRVADVLEMLPGVNCGACGYPGCQGLADAIVSGKANPNMCKPAKQEARDKINQYLDEVAKSLKEAKE